MLPGNWVNDTTLSNWVKEDRKKLAGQPAAGRISRTRRLRELDARPRTEDEVEFLSKAAAYFAAEHR